MKSVWQKKANHIFYQMFAWGAAVLAGLIFLGFRLYPRLVLVWQSLAQKIDMVCGCANHWHFTKHPFIFSFLILMGAAFTGLLVFGLVKIIRSVVATRGFINGNLRFQKKVSLKLKNAALRAGLFGRVIEIDRPEPSVFCFGFLRPKICLSSGLVSRLNQGELLAVLRHEGQHMAVYEPVKLLAIKIMSGILFFVPIFKMLAKKYLTYAELAADEQATFGFKDRLPLARALYKIIKWEETAVARGHLMVSFFSHITEERINKLADNNYYPKFRFLNFKSAIGILVLAAAFFILDSAVNSPKIDAAEAGAYCPMEEIDLISRADECSMNAPGATGDACDIGEPSANAKASAGKPAAWSCHK